VGQGRDNLAFDRDRVSGDFLVEAFAERNRVVATGQFRFVAAIEPETHGVHEVEAGGVHNNVPAGFLLRAEKDCRGSKRRRVDP
jgi:hypothetical protein